MRIYDKTPRVDLRDVLAALGERAISAFWAVSGVDAEGEDVAATGDRADELEALSRSRKRVSGQRLAEIAKGIHQTIGGKFQGYDGVSSVEPWITIIAFDSSWFEIRSPDEGVLCQLGSQFKDTRRIA
jgi:hypothetical protein